GAPTNGNVLGTLRGPCSRKSAPWSSPTCMAPADVPRKNPARGDASASFPRRASSAASREAAMVSWQKRPAVRAFSAGMNWRGRKSGVCAAIRTGYSRTSNRVTGRTVDSPRRRRAHSASPPTPEGATMPRPVTTTRRLATTRSRSLAPVRLASQRSCKLGSIWGHAPCNPCALERVQRARGMLPQIGNRSSQPASRRAHRRSQIAWLLARASALSSTTWELRCTGWEPENRGSHVASNEGRIDDPVGPPSDRHGGCSKPTVGSAPVAKPVREDKTSRPRPVPSPDFPGQASGRVPASRRTRRRRLATLQARCARHADATVLGLHRPHHVGAPPVDLDAVAAIAALADVLGGSSLVLAHGGAVDAVEDEPRHLRGLRREGGQVEPPPLEEEPDAGHHGGQGDRGEQPAEQGTGVRQPPP